MAKDDEQQRKETEDLLSGFDRPARTPRRTPSGRDFVAHYTNPRSPQKETPPRVVRDETDPHEKPTVVVPRKKPWQTTLRWASVVAAMLLLGALVAVVATPRDDRSPPSSASPSPAFVPSSATTITSGIQSPEEPTTTIPVVVDVPARPPSTKKAAPATTSGTSPSTNEPTTIKTAPRDDFIRDM